MAKIFISHSSKDKSTAKKITIDLMKFGHDVWLDEWEINVGDCILTGIEGGIASADYVAIILTPHSISSNWVEKEWKTKYWDEIDKGDIHVLPLLLKDCQIPILLKSKKYADFRTDYESGLNELLKTLNPYDAEWLLIRERIIATKRKLSELITKRIGQESKVFFGKELVYGNHNERFAEIALFAQETKHIYIEEIASEIDEIVGLLSKFDISEVELTQHKKLIINMMGWQKVVDLLNNALSQLENIKNS